MRRWRLMAFPFTEVGKSLKGIRLSSFRGRDYLGRGLPSIGLIAPVLRHVKNL
jgi:hypothetical protein